MTDAGSVAVRDDALARQNATKTSSASPEGRSEVGFPVRPLSGWRAVVKRAEDITLALAILAITWPVMLVIAAAIRLESRGPVLFRQDRVGYGNRPFHILKFRTLSGPGEDGWSARQVQVGDRRVTRVGRILRPSGLDELPQILNVLKGDMSVIGPRPHPPGLMVDGRHFDEIAPHYDARHVVRPGITGLAQVNGCRGATPTDEHVLRRVAYDIRYIQTWSLWLDLQIAVRTVAVMARGRGSD